MSDHQLQNTGIPDGQTVDVFWDIGQVPPHLLNDSNAESRVLATYKSPTTDRTATWTLPWNTEGVLELVDESNRVYHAGTTHGLVTFFSKETDSGPEVIHDESAKQEQVKGQLHIFTIAITQTLEKIGNEWLRISIWNNLRA